MDNHCLSWLWKNSVTLLDRLQFYSHDLALDLSLNIDSQRKIFSSLRYHVTIVPQSSVVNFFACLLPCGIFASKTKANFMIFYVLSMYILSFFFFNFISYKLLQITQRREFAKQRWNLN